MTNIKTNSIKAWLLAARPKTLTGAAIPVMLGCALAFIYGHFQLTPALLCFLFAFLMQIDANFINDLFDFLKGSDREDRLGPERACAQGWIRTRLCTRMDQRQGHESRHCLYHPVSRNHRTLPALLWRTGNDSGWYCLYDFCLPLYRRTVSTGLSRMGRLTGTYFLRLRTRGMYLLCYGTRLEHVCYHGFTGLRPHHRYPADD